MNVQRKINVIKGKYKVGDILLFRLKDGEEAAAFAVEETQDGMIFFFVDCLKDLKPMNSKNATEGGYENSDMRGYLNNELLEMFPMEMREQMLPFSNGDYLRLATEAEIFGENRWPMMKQLRNRIAWRGSNTGVWCYWWLQDTKGETLFAYVAGSGNATSYSASASLGVRPAFILQNPRPLIGQEVTTWVLYGMYLQ